MGIREYRSPPFGRSSAFVPICIFSVGYLNNHDNDLIIIDRIYDAVNALPETVTLFSGELFAARGARVIGQSPDACENFRQILLGNGAQILGDRTL